MNARIKKEMKALAPAFGVTVGVTMAASLVWRGNSALGGGVFLFSVCCTLMGASCFGSEFSSRTMPLLLAQPVPRKKIWNEKMLVLGTAVFLAYAAWLASVTAFTDPKSFGGNDLPWLQLTMALISAGIWCSTPWMALMTRNTLMAALTTWMWPLSIVLLVMAFGSFVSADQRLQDYFATHEAARQWLQTHLHYFHPVLMAVAVALAYCVFTSWRGVVAFKNFQAAEPRQREIALPGPLQDMVGRPLGMLLPRYSSPLASLVRKEILLQRPAYVVAAALCVMALIEMVTFEKKHPSEVTISLLLLNIVLCVGVIPMVVTGLSVAEERNLGVMNWQQLLPPSPWKQWVVKLAVVLATCVLLGVILPSLMGAAGQALGLFSDGPGLGKQIQWWSFSAKEAGCLFYFLLLAIGVFASSVSTTTFRAILLLLGLLCGIAALIVLSNLLVSWITNPFGNWSRVPAPVMLGILDTELVIGLVVLGVLAYANYRVAEPTTRRTWVQSGIVLTVALVLAMAFWIAVL